MLQYVIVLPKEQPMIKAAVHILSPKSVGEKIGYITFSDSPNGLLIEPDVKGLPPGKRGFHIHEYGNLEPKDGKPGGMAGQHYDPMQTGKHLGPYRNGHLGDLPVLVVNRDGTANTPSVAPRLTLDDVVGRSIIIHSGGDNYSDFPVVNGGGKSRIAGGVITNDCPYCRNKNLKTLGVLSALGMIIYGVTKK